MMGEGTDSTGVARLKSCYGAITVEPILFMYHLAGSFQWPTVDAMIYRKVCLEFYNETTCDNLSTVQYTMEEDVVQSHTSYWYLANNLCFEIPSIMTSLFYGNLSDKFSRKTALMLPLIGQMITLAVYFVNSLFFSLPVGLILIGPLLSGMFGGWITCNIASYSYLSEVSTSENRVIRIAIGEGVSALSMSIGFFVSGVTLDHTNFPVVLAISFTIYTLASVYTRLYIKDLNVVSSECTPKFTETTVSNPTKCGGVVKSLCAPKSVHEALFVIFRTRKGRHRTYIIILLFGMFSGVLTGSASWLIGYLFLRRQPLSWTQSLYGYYVGLSAGVHSLGLIALMPVLKKLFHMRDTSILILATILQAVAEAYFGLCNRTWMVFLVPFVGLLSDARPTCSRALLSQLVDRNELGKMFAVVGSFQSIGTLMATFIYNSAYPATLKYWAGMCFAAAAAFTFIPITMFTWVHVDMKKSSGYTRLELDELGDDDRQQLLNGKSGGGDIGYHYLDDLETEVTTSLLDSNDICPEVTQTALTESETTEPTVVEPETTEPTAVEPEAVETHIIKPEVAQ